MSNEVFEKWFAETLQKANGGDSLALSMLESVKASQGADAYKAMVDKATVYDTKHLAKEREQKEWMSAHGTIVLSEYARLDVLRHKLLDRLANVKGEIANVSEQMKSLLTEHSAVVYDEDGTTRVRKAGHRSTNGAKASPAPSGKIWIDGVQMTNSAIAEKYGIASQESGRPVYKTAYLVKKLTDKGIVHELKQ